MSHIPVQLTYDETESGQEELRRIIAQAYNAHDAHTLHEAQARLDAAQDKIFSRLVRN